MTWTCSNCGKSFAKTNQSHHCVIVEREEIFERKEPHLLDLYLELFRQIEKIGPFQETRSRKTLTLYTPAGRSFLCVQPKRKWLDLWFNLERHIDEFPVFKMVQPSKKKFAHFIRIDEMEDIEQIWLDWIAEAYELSNRP